MKKRILLTREEIETRLERGMVGKSISFITIHDKTISGRLQRLAVEHLHEELMVSFMVNRDRYEADLQYFVENTTIHYGNSGNTDQRDVRRILKGD